MGGAVEASVERGPDGCLMQLWVRDPELVGKRATLKVQQHAKVKRSSPVHKQRALAEREFTLQPGQNTWPLGAVLQDAFAYRGGKLDLEVTAHVEIDDGIIFDTKIELDLTAHCALPPRAEVPAAHAALHSPPDRFNFFANLRAIPAKARMVVIWLLVIGLPVVLGNALLGTRDQFVPESQVWFYDHSGDDGSESPLMKALAGSGAAGLALWLAIRRQLQKYMRFEGRLPPGTRIARGARCRAADMVEGQARVALQHSTLRVVAYNREHGQYTAREKSGKTTRTVTRSFCENARAVVLYEKSLAYVPANMPLAGYLDGEVDFSPMFDALYPPFMIGDSHGLSLRLEVQLLHPEFVDQDIELDPGPIDAREFWVAAGA